MADPKYQIFVSSTYEDLKEERRIVIEAILKMQHLPSSMERFPASSKSQMKCIRKIIDNCDYYILIIGDRYGSIDAETGFSYTEQEYDYAISKNIPVLAFWKEKCDESKQDFPEELKRFTKKVQEGRLCRPWNSIIELQSEIFSSLPDEIEDNPQQGWTRGGGEDNKKLLEELNELRKEKDALQNQVGELQAKLQEHTWTQVENLADMDEGIIIKGKNHYTNLSFSTIWNEIFSLVGPYLVSPQNYSSFSILIKNNIEKLSGYPKFWIEEDIIQTIKFQFDAQSLIEVYQAQATNGGLTEFICLTPKGKQYLMRIKTVKSNKEEMVK